MYRIVNIKSIIFTSSLPHRQDLARVTRSAGLMIGVGEPIGPLPCLRLAGGPAWGWRPPAVRIWFYDQFYVIMFTKEGLIGKGIASEYLLGKKVADTNTAQEQRTAA